MAIRQGSDINCAIWWKPTQFRLSTCTHIMQTGREPLTGRWVDRLFRRPHRTECSGPDILGSCPPTSFDQLLPPQYEDMVSVLLSRELQTHPGGRFRWRRRKVGQSHFLMATVSAL